VPRPAWNDQRQQRVPMPLGVANKRGQTHAHQEDRDIPEKNRQRMPHQEVLKPLPTGGLHVALAGHDRKRPDVRRLQPAVVMVVMVVRAAPDAHGRQAVNAEGKHHPVGRLGAVQQRPMLVVVIDHEQPHDQKSAQNTEPNPQRQWTTEHSGYQRHSQHDSRGQEVPPALAALLACELS
jgi:hypothetical protein